MEKQLFTCNGFDVLDTMSFAFYDCELKVPIGPYAAGTSVQSICLDYEMARIEIYDRHDETPAWTGNLLLTVDTEHHERK